jgi:DNA-directed RNA polymerase specialized sigma24 family protein
MKERTNRIVTLLSMGIEPKRVALQNGLTYQAVRSAGLRHGVKRRSEIKRERFREWEQLHQIGFSMAEVAWLEGVPATTVRSALERLRKQEVARG